ncbi:hypothetical protein [Novosphingobium sp.]|uniref:hypothetical protein n=1 Tax=Novosphingobium sp. TaxID=1874826 RepID=UPI003BACE719
MIAAVLLAASLAVASASAAPVAAAEQISTSPCRAAMSREWPRLSQVRDKVAMSFAVDAKGNLEEQPDKAAERDYADKVKMLGTLEQTCAGDEEALRDLASLQAEASLARYQPKAALAQLQKFRDSDQDRLKTRNLWLLQSAAFLSGDKQGVDAATTALVDANERALLASGNWILAEKGAAKRVDYNIYRATSDPTNWLFIVRPRDGNQVTAVYARHSDEYSTPEKPIFELRHLTCNSDGAIDPGKLEENSAPAFDAVRAQVLGYFDGTVAPYQNDSGGPMDDMTPSCLQAGKILPGLGDPYQYDGTEYRDPAQLLTSYEAAIWLQSPVASKREQAVAHVTAHPDAVEPFGYIPVITVLLQSGDTAQAVFWYYVFQIRIYPWLKTSDDPSGAPALYGSIAESLGRGLNEWAGSDIDAMRDLMQRAASFERAAPLFLGRTEGVSAEQWQALIEKGRSDFLSAQAIKALSDKNSLEAARKKNGLYVGPWQSPGAPLPENWR